MWDKTNKPHTHSSAAVIAVMLILTGGILAGCSSGSWNGGGLSAPVQTATPVEPAEKPVEHPVGDSRKFQPPRDAAPEDVEAFLNTVDQISRLEYSQAEGELRVLLVRFESVDDPRYVSETLFWLGYCCEKQGVIDQARDYYQRAVEHYPDSRPGRQAAQRLKILPVE